MPHVADIGCTAGAACRVKVASKTHLDPRPFYSQSCRHRIVSTLVHKQRRQAQLQRFFRGPPNHHKQNATPITTPQTKRLTCPVVTANHQRLERTHSQSSTRPHEPTRRSCQKGGRNPAQELCPNRRPLTVSVRPFGPRLETAERPPNCSPI